MASLNYFSEARKRKSQELLLVLGSEAKCRVQQSWISLNAAPVLLSEWNQILKSFLKNEQLQRLEREGTLQGCSPMPDGSRISYHIFQSHDCFKSHFYFEPLNVFEIELSLPAVFLETVRRCQGLILLAGPVHPYKTNTLAQTLYRLNKDRAFHGAICSKQAFPGIPEEKASFVYQSVSVTEAAENGFFAGADIVVLHETVTARSLAHAMDLCDEGKMVVMTVASHSLVSAFHKCLELLSERPNPHSLWRFADHLKMAISQHPLTSLSEETILGFEMLLNTPQLKTWLGQGQLGSLEALLQTQQENSGVL
ncbi:MAG: hypothetical protein ACXWRA_09710, partial [Pseudobdellovibrionaceae bacterium]